MVKRYDAKFTQDSFMINKTEAKNLLKRSKYLDLIYGIKEMILDSPDKGDKLILFYMSPKDVYEMTYAEFLIHLILWQPNVVFNLKVNQDDVYELAPFGKNKLNKIINERIKKFVLLTKDVDTLDLVFSDIIQKCADLADDYSPIAGNTFNLREIMRMENEDSYFSTLFNYGVGNLITSISGTENFLKNIAPGVLKDAFTNDKKNCFRPFIYSDRLNTTQLVQSMVSIAYRNGVSKEIIQTPIVSNYVKGLRSPSDVFIEANSTRIAAVAKKKSVPQSGYLSRRAYLLCGDTMINQTVIDCGTTHTVNVFVESQKILDVIRGKYMVLADKTLKEIDETDTHLIGTRVNLRSHIKCKLPDDQVCQTCFGAKAILLQNVRIGGLPSVEVINPISNAGMAVKHQTSTSSYELKNTILREYFMNDGNYITIKEGMNKRISIKVPKYYLEDWIMGESVTSEPNKLPYFIIYDHISGVEHKIEDKGISYMLDSSMLELARLFKVDVDCEITTDEVYLLPISNRSLNVDSPLFEIIYNTEEVSAHLTALENVMVKNQSVQEYDEIDAIIYDFINVVINSGVKHTSSFIHIETILYNMIRDKYDALKRPNYNLKHPEWQIFSLKNAILAKDFCKGLAFEDLGRQLSDPLTYKKRGVSVFDAFFRNHMSIANGKGIVYGEPMVPKSEQRRLIRL